jgi:Ca2+-binding EF-hand superfamily protein
MTSVEYSFARMDLSDDGPAHPVNGRTLALQAPNTFRGATANLPKQHRMALEQAQTTKSMSYAPEKATGPLHFKLAKAGTGRVFDVHLGDPVVCEQDIPGRPGRRCDEGTTLFLSYYVLVRVLAVPLDDAAINQVPKLESRTIERILRETTRRKKRALGGRKTQFTGEDYVTARESYERPTVEGEAEFDFLAELGRGIGTQSAYFLGRDIDDADAVAKAAHVAGADTTLKSFDPARDEAWAAVMAQVNTEPKAFRTNVAKVFRRLDFQGNGNVVINELLEALRPFGVDLSLDQSKALAKQLDVFGHQHEDGQISQAEFLGIVDAHAAECRDIVWTKLMAEVDKDPNVWERNLKLLFINFDSDGSGDIDLDELAQGLASLGIELLRDQLVALRNEMDFDGDGQISLREFSIAVANYRAEKVALRDAKVHARLNKGGRGRGVGTYKQGGGSDWGSGSGNHFEFGATTGRPGVFTRGVGRARSTLVGGESRGVGNGGAPVHANMCAQQHGGMPPIGWGGATGMGMQGRGMQQGNEEKQEEFEHHLGVGDATPLSAMATMRQGESLWHGTLHRRRRLREGEPYGQTREVSAAAAAAAASANDPHWALAKAETGPATFPWRRALPLSEKVARLVKDPSRGSSFLGDPDFPWKGPLSVGLPGMDDMGRKSSRIPHLPDYPYNAPGGRVVVAPGTVLPAGMRIRHPAMLNASTFQAAIKDFLYVWESCGDPVKKSALGMAVEVLWLKYTKFRSWAKVSYRANKKRTDFMREHPIRFTVHCPDGRVVQVRMSRLSTGLQVKQHLEKKVKSARRGQFVRGRHVQLVFDGAPLDDRVSLKDAGVGPRSTLVLTKVAAQMLQGDDGLPVY